MTFVNGSAPDELEKMEAGSIQTIVTDPPYNLGFDYGPVSDSMPRDDYLEMMRQVAFTSLKAVAEDGSFFLIHYPDEAARLLPIFEAEGWRLHQWLSWVYPQNIGHSQKKWTRAHRAILWFSKSERPKFYPERVLQPYRNPNDKRIKGQMEKGRQGTHLYDWWEVNIQKNVGRDYKGYSNQIPEEVLRRIILCTTDTEDVVGDPFSGTFSTARTALKYGRKVWGCDLNPHALEFSKDLLSAEV